MKFSFDEEQLELKRSARKFLATHSSAERVRAAMASPLGYDEAVYQTLATELGWVALAIPEAYGGLGLSAVDLVPVLEEMGRANYAGPFFSTVCLAANALLVCGTDAQRERYLTPIAAGELLGTVAFAEAAFGDATATVAATLTPDGAGYRLDGVKRYVLDGHLEGLLVVLARLAGTQGDDGLALVAVPPGTAGVVREATPTVDQTRRLATVRFEAVAVSADDVLAQPGTGRGAFEALLDRAITALAAEQVGGAEACLDMAVDYAKVRKQFGRPIGTFQAIQHTCANMLLRVESAKSAAYYAAATAADGGREHTEAASIAKSYCSEAFFQCAADSIQVHGGIGFTWEHEAHLYFKRARAGEHFLGEPAYHRERVLRALSL